jgi:lauroyl/myristoyl acyltransferase
MGNYDLGSYLFARDIEKPITIVRAAERDPDTDREARAKREQVGEQTGRMQFGEPSAELAFSLVEALQEGKVVAIQGDRAIKGVASIETTLFGRKVELPAGPFYLALTTRSPIYPLFVIRTAIASYKVITRAPIEVRRTGRNRDEDVREAVQRWTAILEEIIGGHATQWFNFDDYFGTTA